jgi:hypothetical protein
MTRACSRNEEKRNACKKLVGKAKGKRPRHKWVDNIKIVLREIG